MLVFIPPPSYHSHSLGYALSLSLFFFFPLSFLQVSLCLFLSLAAARRREEAITAAHEGGWEKKKHTRKTAPIPSGLSAPIQPPKNPSSPPPHHNLLHFLTRQTEGKTVAVSRPFPSALPE